MASPKCCICRSPEGVSVLTHEPDYYPKSSGGNLAFGVPPLSATVTCPRCGLYWSSVKEEPYLHGMNQEERRVLAGKVREANATCPGPYPVLQAELFTLCPTLCARVDQAP